MTARSQPRTVRETPVHFESEGTRCAATLYYPDGSTATDTGDPPVVVMANGFGLPRSAGLPAVAERFAERGLAVLLFDYRSLGESDGEPRNVILPAAQLADWRAAVEYARTADGVDGTRIGLWGFSLGGGGAFVTAATEDVDAYVGQTPIFDGARTVAFFVRQVGLLFALRTTLAGLRDVARKYTGREPYYLPVWGDYPEDLPALPTAGSKEGHEAVVGGAANDPTVNRCAARAFLTFGLYRPIRKARDVDCPALVVRGTEDRIAPGNAIEATVVNVPDVRLVDVETDHFGSFFGERFEEVVELEGAFLERHLLEERPA